MTNFKVGDKVRFLKFWEGEGTVIEVNTNTWPVRVRDKHGREGSFNAHELELVPAHKFKVGDWVEITGWGGGYEGQIKQIASVPYPGYIYYSFVDKSGGFSDKYLKAAKAPAKFKVGDWVKVSNRKDSWDGTVGTVREVKDDCGYGVCYTIHKNNVGDTYKQSVSKNVLHFFEDNLVATTEPVKTVKGFKVGSKVIGVKMHHKDDVMTVKELSGGGTYVTCVDAVGYICQMLPEEIAPYTPPALFSKGGYFPAACDRYSYADLYSYANLDAQLKAKVVGKFDNVDGPAHYGGKDNPFEVIKVAEAWGFEKNAYLFNALKYLARAGKKGSKVEDLKKLQYYVAREIALEEAKK